MLSLRTRICCSAILLGLASTGCGLVSSGKARPASATASGERLAVVDDVKVWTTTQDERVGQQVHRDGNGNVVGVSDVYAAQTRAHRKPIWYPMQGQQRLTDEDFFRITGDTASLRTSVHSRTRARRQLRVGQVMVVAGAGAAIGSLFVSRLSVKAGLAGGGLLTALLGWYVGNSASKRLEADYHAVPRQIAEDDARRYNQGLGLTTELEVGVGGSF